jgi:hypothetical protein
VEALDSGADPRTDRVKRLYDRLAKAIEGLSPDRLEALEEYLEDEQAKEAGSEGNDPDRPATGDDRAERHDD